MDAETVRAAVAALLTSDAGRGALQGAIVAASADYAAFRSWKRLDDAFSYDWGVAAWRWFQGAVVGAVTRLGGL